MEQQISEMELFQSCQILFGDDLHISRDFLDYLQASGIKTAYRKKAMETHPDRLIGQELQVQRQGAEDFRSLQDAYNNLLSFLKAKEAGQLTIGSHRRTTGSSGIRAKRTPAHSKHRPAHPYYSNRTENRYQSFHLRTMRPIVLQGDVRKATVYANTERLYEGAIPLRPLLFGHFLYYSGLTNWRTITRILTWQRMERPRLGELGTRFGMFKQEDITTILRARKPYRPFGETAQILGLLTEHQVRVLMFHQQRLQKKFGTILLEKNLINRQQLQELLDQFEHHNTSVDAQ